tara:strand:- start:8813 stop:8983 length:171 start_codon:yes stop_codon:yes gene_type:complete
MDINKMIAVIQIYIFYMKGVEVNINPKLPKDIPKLTIAYNIAESWISENIISIKQI